MANPEARDRGTVECDECGQTHEAHYHHDAMHGSARMFAVVCDPDIVDYYAEDRVTF